ncbi:MAG: hypothetical protein MJY71_02420 [Bacteroidaceae bacterium]|nr:hypothetical protein [Bacteroidaceae bacterium]
MAEDNGRLNFSASIDNSELQRSVEESRRLLDGIGDEAEKQGNRLDDIFDGMREASRAAAQVFSELSTQYDVSDAEHKTEALRDVIDANTESVEILKAKFEELSEQAQEAFAEGNFAEFDRLTEQMQETATRISDLNSETERYSTVLQQMESAAEGAAGAVDDMSEEEEEESNILVKLLGGQEKYNALMSQMPDSVQAAAKSITQMTGAAKAFIATPLGAIIAAIVVVLQTLKTWFNSTAEGQMAFAKVSGYVSGVLGQLKEIVITVGKALYDAFSNPREAITNLWTSIKENIVNRFKSLGDMASALGGILKAAFTFDREGIKQSAKELADSFMQFTTLDDAAKSIKDWGSSVNDAAKATAEIRQQEKQLEVEVSEWQKRKEELDKTKAEARMKMYDTTLSNVERKEAMDAYKEALDEQVRVESDFADRRIDLQKRSMELTSNTIEDENRLRELETERLRIDTQAAQEMAMLQRRSNSFTNGKTEDTAAKELLTLQQNTAQAQIELMKEGSDKKIRQIQLDYEREIAEYQLQEQKWRDAQGGALTETQQTALTAAREQARKTLLQKELDESIQGIETYEQRRTDLERQYAENRARLYENGALRQGVSQGNVDELNRQEQETMQALDIEFANRQEAFQSWCNEIANLSLEQLEELLARAQDELAALEREGETDSNKIAAARAKVATADKKVRQAKADAEINPDKRSIKEWEDLYSVLNDCNDIFEEIGETVGGTAGEIIKTVGTISSATLQMINGILTVTKSSEAAIQSTSTAGTTAIKAMESASVILTVISAALQIAQAIAQAVTSDAAREARIEALQTEIDRLQWEIDHADVVRLQRNYSTAIDMTADAFKRYRDEMDAALVKIRQKEELEAWEKINNDRFITDINRRSIEKAKNTAIEIQYEQQRADAVKRYAADIARAYANVEYTADKALGEERYKEATAQLENYTQQMLDLQDMINEEQDAKKPDDDNIREWNKTIEELGSKSVQLMNEMTENIIGDSATGIAEELSDAFFDAFQNGEDYAEAWGNKVNDITGDIVRRMLTQQFLEEPLGKIFNTYKGKWFNDGEFVGIDAFIDSMDEFAADLNEKKDNFAAMYESLPEDIKSLFAPVADSTREATAGGIATASQESVDELNGRMTAVQGHTYSIAENTQMLVTNTTEILRSVMQIENNTDRLAAVESSLRDVRSTLSDINLFGIKIKAL